MAGQSGRLIESRSWGSGNQGVVGAALASRHAGNDNGHQQGGLSDFAIGESDRPGVELTLIALHQRWRGFYRDHRDHRTSHLAFSQRSRRRGDARGNMSATLGGYS
jgi:hypothetical protein